MTQIKWADRKMLEKITFFSNLILDIFIEYDSTDDEVTSTLANLLGNFLYELDDEDLLDKALQSIKFVYYERKKKGLLEKKATQRGENFDGKQT